MHNLTIVKDRIVARAFPEIVSLHISLEYKPLKDAYSESWRVSPRRYNLDMDSSLRVAPLEVLEGAMAHDLAHIVRDFKKSKWIHNIDIFLYSHFPTYQTRDERRTDLLVIERGFGESLLALLKYANSNREEYTPEDGLTLEEVEGILNRTKPIQ